MELPPTTVIADDPIPQVPGTTPKLRLMCSYGGHIVPTPHEKSLRYLGGETRIVVVDRRSSLASILSHLSSSLLHGRRNFSLKYQLPNEELDSLVSLSSDEDLENLIEEYDRIVATVPSSSPAFRLRIFIFFCKPETAALMGSLLDDVKSENWFVDALNGVSLLPRGLSDSAAVVDQLLDPDNVSVENNEKQTNNAIDAHEVFAGMSDSSPSFGSSSSSPLMSNLPPIRVRVEESVTVGTEETVVNKSGSAPYSDAVVHKHNVDFVANAGEVDQFQAVSEDERSDRSTVQAGFRKPPLPMYLSTQHVQQQNKNGLPNNLPSPDSVAREKSIKSASSESKLLFYQDPVQTNVKENRAPGSPLDPRKLVHESNPPYQMMQLHETTYLMPSQPVYSQQQHQKQLQQQLHQQLQLQQLEAQQQGYYNASMRPESETLGSQMPLSGQSDQYQNSNSQNQRGHHLQETRYISSPPTAEHQQSLQHQQQHFIHRSMLQSYETPAVQGQISEQSPQLFQHQLQNQFVPAIVQHVYHPAPNQADQQLQEQQAPQSQNQVIQGSVQYVNQGPTGQVPMPSYYSVYTTQLPHQQLHPPHQTLYMMPVAQAQPNKTLPPSNNISDGSQNRYPAQLNTSMLPAPAIQTQIQMETPSSSVLMSQNPTLIQQPYVNNQQQCVSYSQFLHPPQSMAVPFTRRDAQVYYTNQQHSSVVSQCQTMNSFNHGHDALPSDAAFHLSPADQHQHS